MYRHVGWFLGIFLMLSTSAGHAFRFEIPGLGEVKGDDPNIPIVKPIVEEGAKLIERVKEDPTKIVVNPAGYIDTTGIPKTGDFVEYVIKNPEKAIELITNPGDIPYMPVANAIISGRNAVIAGNGKPIPEDIKVFLRRWYPDDLIDSVRYTSNWGPLRSTLQAAQMTFNRKTGAIALINAVVFRDEELASSPALWAHELFHVQQYRAWGVFGFAKQWVDNSAPGGPVEAPAYARQEEAETVMAEMESDQPEPINYVGSSNETSVEQNDNAESSDDESVEQDNYVGSSEEESVAQNEPAPMPVSQPLGFMSGYPTTPCGCWGYVQFGAGRPAPHCSSGYEIARPCPGLCSAGGMPWQSACY